MVDCIYSRNQCWSSVSNDESDVSCSSTVVNTAPVQKNVVVQNRTQFHKMIPLNAAHIDMYQLYQSRAYLSKITLLFRIAQYI